MPFGRGFDTRSECEGCGQRFGRHDVIQGGRCMRCAGDSKIKHLLSDQYQDVGTRNNQVSNFHGLYDRDEDDPHEPIRKEPDYHKEIFDFGDTVAFTEHGQDNPDGTSSYTKRSIRRLRRGSMEKPDWKGDKYHTEGDVGT